MSANEKSISISASSDTEFSYLQNSQGSIHICFTNTEKFRNTFGDVREVLLQEYCASNPINLCPNISVRGKYDYAKFYGSRGVLHLFPNGTGL